MEFPIVIEMLIREFKGIKGTRVELREHEIELFAPDPDIEEEQEAFDQLNILCSQFNDFGFITQVFCRGEGHIDALRVTPKENVEKYEEEI